MTIRVETLALVFETRPLYLYKWLLALTYNDCARSLLSQRNLEQVREVYNVFSKKCLRMSFWCILAGLFEVDNFFTMTNNPFIRHNSK